MKRQQHKAHVGFQHLRVPKLDLRLPEVQEVVAAPSARVLAVRLAA